MKSVKMRAEVVERVRPAGMPGHHDALDRRQAAVDVLAHAHASLACSSLSSVADVDLAVLAEALELLDLALELLQRLLEVERVR